MDLGKLAASIDEFGGSDNKIPPVESWNPPYCGDIGLKIRRNGQWESQGSPIGRAKLVKLFSTILKREGDAYYLVTPVEKIAVQVEDVPFVITQWQQQGEHIGVQTQCADHFVINPEHSVELRFDNNSETQIPYVNVRRNLWARVHQNVFYQWADLAETETHADGTTSAFLTSGEYRFAIGHF